MTTLKTLVDETTNIKDDLKTCHTNLKNNLIKKGVECSDSDKMSSLIDIVGNIELGKKWASGEAMSTSNSNKISFTYSNGVTEASNYARSYVEISTLSFNPSFILMCSTREDRVSNSYSIYGNLNNKNDKSLYTVKMFLYNDQSLSTSCNNYKVDNKILNNNILRIPVSLDACKYNWIAFE